MSDDRSRPRRTARVQALAACLLACLLALPIAHAQAVLRDAETEAFLAETAEPLARAAGLEPDALRFRLIERPFMNAYVTDGHTIVVQSGLFAAVQHLGELESVLAHEIGHIEGGDMVQLRQAQKRARRLRYVNYTLGALFLAGALAEGRNVWWGGPNGIAVGPGQPDIDDPGRNPTVPVLDRPLIFPAYDPAEARLLRFSRVQEHGADQAAIRLMAEACLDPADYVALLARLEPQAFYPQDLYKPYFNTHPEPDHRLRAVADKVAERACLRDPGQKADLDRRFERVRAKVLGFTESLTDVYRRFPGERTDLPARYARAHGMWRARRLEDALAELSPLAEDDAYVWEVRALIHRQLGRVDTSRAAIDRAVALQPDSPLLRQAKADIWLTDPDLNWTDLTEIAAQLEQALVEDRENNLLWAHLARARFRLEQEGAARLALAERYALEGDLSGARFNVDKAIALLDEGSPGYRQALDLLASLEG